MNAPVLQPARWWRDDSTRYNARPLVGVCRSWAQPATGEWAWDLVRPPDPELLRAFDALFEASRPERIATALMLPVELLDTMSSEGLRP